jgi:hypothetical protein
MLIWKHNRSSAVNSHYWKAQLDQIRFPPDEKEEYPDWEV